MFDAYEFRKLWLDPPPLRAVLAKRLSLAKILLNEKSVKIPLEHGAVLHIPNLGDFFEIVQRSTLEGPAGEFIEAMADINIRKGLTLMGNFLTSGHIHADKAIKVGIDGQATYRFPFQEIFKGTMLGQWMHYKERRAECINVFDSRAGSRKLRLLRLHLIRYLHENAREARSLEVTAEDCIAIFSRLGASESKILSVLNTLMSNGLVRNSTADQITSDSTIFLTRNGGYYSKFLSASFPYVEACMIDTAIEDEEKWQELADLTAAIENENNISNRMILREERMVSFLGYLNSLEIEALVSLQEDYLASIPLISERVLRQVAQAVVSAHRHYN